MRPSIKAIILTAAFTMGASSLAVAQPSTWAEQWYRAKFGRPSPTEQARLDAAKPTAAPNGIVNTSYATAQANVWLDQWFRDKYGRHTPMVEARLTEARLGMHETMTNQASAPANTWFENWYRAKFGRPSPTEEARLNAAKQTTPNSTVTTSNDLTSPTNDQRVALQKCMKATDQVRIHASQMQVVGRPWGRGRTGYSKNDLVALSDYRDELKLALSNLAAVHQEFLKELSEAQEQRLDQRLRKLDHLQAEFRSKISEFDHDLLRTEPGPDSTGIAWDVNSLKRTADKWLSEHRKISKELNLQDKSIVLDPVS